MKTYHQVISACQSLFFHPWNRKLRLWLIRFKTKKQLVFLLILFALGMLQITWLDAFKFFNVKPDLILIAALLANFFFEFKEAIILSFVAGLFKDILGAQVFGINTLLFPLWSFLLAQLNRQISLDHELFRVVLVALLTCLHHALTGLQLTSSGSAIPAGIFLRIVLLETIYTTALAFLILKNTHRFFQRRYP